MFYNPFVGNSRMNFMQPQNQFTQPQQQQYDFSGWGDRLTKIEEGIAGLTNQFNNFQPQTTGQNNMVNTPTNTAPEPLGSIGDLGSGSGMGKTIQPGNQLDSKPISPFSQHLMDGEWRQLTPEEFGTKFPNSPFNQNGTMQQPNQPFQTFASPSGGKSAEQFPWLQGYQGSMNDINAIDDYRVSQIDPNVQRRMQGPMQQQVQPQIGAGLTGLAAYQSQNKGMV